MSEEIARPETNFSKQTRNQGPNKQIDLSFSDKKYTYSTYTRTIVIIEGQTYLRS